MSDRNPFTPLVEEVDFLLAARRDTRARGVHLIVTHLDHIPEMRCGPGEIIGDFALGGLPEPVSLGLSHVSLLLMDCLCRYRMPLTAVRIEQIMSTEPFYVEYAENRIGCGHVIARPDRHTVRVYVPRIWKQMKRVFRELGLNIDPRRILVAEMTDTNIARYQLRATFEVVHVDSSAVGSVARHDRKNIWA
jgi:hypothetical protein